MTPEHNPYRTGEDIEVVVRRDTLLRSVLQDLLVGGGVGYLLGSRGLGKSIFLHHLRQELSATPRVEALLFRLPPVNRTFDSVLHALVEALLRGQPESEAEVLRPRLQGLADPLSVVQEYLRHRQESVQTLVLLYDELNDYVDPSGFGREWFKHLESARKALSSRLKVFAAGGLGLFVVGDSLASPFLSRARGFSLLPFTREELRELADPLAEKHGGHLPDEIIDQILLHSGGNPYLAQYGMRALWDRPALREQDVIEIYAASRVENDGFHQQFRRAFADARLSRLPILFWNAIRGGGGRLRQARIEEILSSEDNPLQLDIVSILRLLTSAGLVRIDPTSSPHDDPILVSAIPSILNFEPRGSIRSRPSLREQLVEDLLRILALIRSMALDMFLQGGRIVEEKFFSALVATNLHSRGWAAAAREVRTSTGAIDVEARHPRFPGELAVIEVKHWPRNDAYRAHQQALDYGDDASAGGHGSLPVLAVIMIAAKQGKAWREEYRDRCLTKDAGVESAAWVTVKGPIGGYYVATSVTGGPPVDHFLLQLPRRQKPGR